MVRGVSIEGVNAKGVPVRPVALVAEDREPAYSEAGLRSSFMLRQLLAMTDTGADLVTFSVDYFASLLLNDAPFPVLSSLWEGKRTEYGDFLLSYVPSLYLWIYRPSDKMTCKITDCRKWGAETLTETANLYGIEAHTPVDRWKVSIPDDALALAQASAATYGEIGRAIVEAFTRAGLPRYWRDGTGRVAGSLLDQMAHRGDVSQYPGAVSTPVQTAYFGGRVDISTVGELGDVTQLDIRSAYPSVMAKLPSMESAKWRRLVGYDASRPLALWFVEWDVPDGARIGPFPLRRNQAVTYPLRGAGWHWDGEVRAAIDVFGSACIRPAHGFAVEPASDRAPFAGLRDIYARRAVLRDSGDASAAHVIKLALTSCYGRLAQERTADGKRGRWANLALAGIVTSETRAAMLRLYGDHWEYAAAIATDSLTVRGTVPLESSRDLGGLSVERGTDAILLPSGAYHAITGTTTLDRVSGVDRNRSRLIDWQDVRAQWHVVGLALHYRIPLPYFVGIGLAVNGNPGAFCQWKIVSRDIVGGVSWDTSQRIDWRAWHVMPGRGDGGVSEMYAPRPGVVSRLPDQSLIDTVDVIAEHAIPH